MINMTILEENMKVLERYFFLNNITIRPIRQYKRRIMNFPSFLRLLLRRFIELYVTQRLSRGFLLKRLAEGNFGFPCPVIGNISALGIVSRLWRRLYLPMKTEYKKAISVLGKATLTTLSRAWKRRRIFLLPVLREAASLVCWTLS